MQRRLLFTSHKKLWPLRKVFPGHAQYNDHDKKRWWWRWWEGISRPQTSGDGHHHRLSNARAHPVQDIKCRLRRNCVLNQLLGSWTRSHQRIFSMVQFLPHSIPQGSSHCHQLTPEQLTRAYLYCNKPVQTTLF